MPDDRPNIVLIMTDQQRFDTIRSLGFPHMDTPNLDRLVYEGVSFNQTCVTAPSCAPSRASLFTGYYPHTTGIFKNGDAWRHSWVERLAESGYYCVNIGKMHTGPLNASLGFHERYIVENKDRYFADRYFFDEWDKGLRARGLVKQQREQYRLRPDYGQRLGAFEWKLPEDAHSDMFVGDMARWWLTRRPNVEPLFLQIGFPGPHPPYDPIPRYAEPYMQRSLPLPQVTPEELDAQPPPLKALRQQHMEVDYDSTVHLPHPSQEQLHRQRAYYFANITMIDEKIGQICEALERMGYLENTIIIFTSDHGDTLCDHGHSQKWTMYDAVVRVPLIVWSPGRFPGGFNIDVLLQHMDIGHTILELCGVDVPESFETQSLLPLLNGSVTQGRQYVFAEHSRDGILRATDFMTMVRDERWKLVHFLDADFGQLFDLQNDPGEKLNLWNDPQCADRKETLLAVMRDWLIRSHYRTRDWPSAWR